MKFKELVQSFAEQLGIELPVPEADGSYRFWVDDKYTLACIPAAGNKLVLMAELVNLPQEEWQKKEFLKDVLKLNLARMYFQGEVLAVDSETQKLILFNRISIVNLDVEGFISLFESFLNSLDFWSEYTSQQNKLMPENLAVFFP